MNTEDRGKENKDPQAGILDDDPNIANDNLSDEDLQEAAGGWAGDPNEEKG